ncbi:MAG TPA: copper transporter [Pseudonocardiaceae bacterium]|nr:copper transporter [Pseudonocardiaceae bacterium]
MISLRYHVISIGAVFLALALGVLLGSTTLSDSLLSGISGQKAQLGEQVTDLQAQRNALNAQLSDADRFATGIGPLAVRGLLNQRTVVIVETATASQADESALADLIKASGADITGTLQLTQAFSNPNRADQLNNMVTQLIPAGARLPVASDAGTLTGGLLGDLLLLNKQNDKPQATATERAAALSALASAGFIKPAAANAQPAQLAVVLTGGAQTGPTAGDNATMLANFATQLAKTSAATVLAGTAGSANGNGPLGVVRATPAATQALSTVDNTNTAAGRVVTILALQKQLAGTPGAYGTAANAQSPAPNPTAS